MQLLLVRHAEASPGTPDELRPLTPHGRGQARALGERLREDGFSPDAVLTSPLLRARETGALLGAELGMEPRVDERLAPGATPEGVTSAAAAHGEIVVAVAHQPDLSHIAAALTGEPAGDLLPAGTFSIRIDA